VLRRDDGFGVVVAQELEREPLPDGVRVLDVGIGGIHLVHELFDTFDALIVVDALDLGAKPGLVSVVRPAVREPAGVDDLADMHYATPERAFMLANALGVLPANLWIVGCQPLDASSLGDSLTPAVAAAVATAIGEVRRLVAELGIRWDAP
jgi:hydrogenase maturation protease